MFSQTTRLEFIIVAVALLVLLMCSQPPKSGNANVQMPPSEPIAAGGSDNPPVPEDFTSQTTDQTYKQLPQTPLPVSDVPAVRGTEQSSLTGPAQIRTIRLRPGTAQNVTTANNEETPGEEIAVRYVWDGTKLVPQKVRIVDEGNGVRSIYSFDQ